MYDALVSAGMRVRVIVSVDISIDVGEKNKVRKIAGPHENDGWINLIRISVCLWSRDHLG